MFLPFMLTFVWAVGLLLPLQNSAKPSPGETSGTKMVPYQLVLLNRGPALDKAGSAEGQQIIKDHIAFISKLGTGRTAVAAGPFLDDGGAIQGIVMIDAATPDEARNIAAADPAVKAGIFSVEVLPFLAPEDWFGTWGEFGQFEKVYFGFLNRGPNRGQDPETARRLQAEHLAYMAGQAKEGKLVVAGPVAVDGPRRGIVVYRVDSPEEAALRATADPMVKAGRLEVELHPWQVPKGALPLLPR